MEIIRVKNYQMLSVRVLQIMEDRIKSNPKINLGLATGSSPVGIYKGLIEAYNAGELSFKNVKTFNLDEYVGLTEAHPQSYRNFMNQHLFDFVDIQKKNVHIPSGELHNIGEECALYDEKIEEAGGIDIQILGIGRNGHIAFNEPGTSFNIGTHVVKLDESTRIANSRFFSSTEEVPTHAVTMGLSTILKSKEIILMISGEKKREAVRKLLDGKVTEDFPASILHTHKKVTVFIDEAAFGDKK